MPPLDSNNICDFILAENNFPNWNAALKIGSPLQFSDDDYYDSNLSFITQ
jgi:hypothetical protein